MATRYSDRAFISVNGALLSDLESGSLRLNKARREVSTMTNDGFNRGFVEGNWVIDISATIAVRNLEARPKLEALDYENNDVQITFRFGQDVYVCTGVFLKDTSDDASGVGQEVKTTFNFGALKFTDTVGNSALFNVSF